MEFDDTRRSISSDDGFVFAFGISDFGGVETSPDTYLDYGTLVAQYEQWNMTSRSFLPINTRKCLLSDFGLDPTGKVDNQTFFDANPIQT